MIKHGLDLNDRFLSENDYSYVDDSDILMKNEILAYNDGLKWKVVPLDIAKKYPVIHDKYYDDTDDTTYPISISLCPFTLSCSVFYGIYTPSEYTINSSLILTNTHNDLLPIISGCSTDPDGKISRIKRWECFIKTFRNAVMDYPDCVYIKLKDGEPNDILHPDYYTDTKLAFHMLKSPDIVHPKTLVYVLQYRSLKTKEYKYTILVGKDADMEHPTGYNTKESGVSDYIQKMDFKLSERSVYIMPILWCSWINFFPYSKIIKL